MAVERRILGSFQIDITEGGYIETLVAPTEDISVDVAIAMEGGVVTEPVSWCFFGRHQVHGWIC